ncbi:MAG: hypothetical protein ACKOWF_19910 [Chloroflexota bacterium]
MAARSGSYPAVQEINGIPRSALGVGAIYDGVLGLLFLVAYGPLLTILGVPLPENPIYLQLAAGLIAVMGLLQYFAWKNGAVHDETIMALVVFKALYVLLAIFSGIRGELPHPVFGVFAAIDLAFMAIFLGMLRTGGETRTR